MLQRPPLPPALLFLARFPGLPASSTQECSGLERHARISFQPIVLTGPSHTNSVIYKGCFRGDPTRFSQIWGGSGAPRSAHRPPPSHHVAGKLWQGTRTGSNLDSSCCSVPSSWAARASLTHLSSPTCPFRERMRAHGSPLPAGPLPELLGVSALLSLSVASRNLLLPSHALQHSAHVQCFSRCWWCQGQL